jgi:hypothetical protein
MTRLAVTLTSSLLLLAIPGAVSAQDFTFNVPVVVKSLVVSSIQVRCEVYVDQAASASGQALGQAVGMENKNVDASGGFTGAVSVKAYMQQGSPRLPGELKFYRCNLYLPNAGSPSSDATAPLTLRAQSGVPYVPVVEGTIP